MPALDFSVTTTCTLLGQIALERMCTYTIYFNKP